MYKESILNILSTKEVVLRNENYVRIEVINILGETSIDLSKFQFINSTLEIRVTNILGSVKFLTNSNSKVVTNQVNFLSSSKVSNTFIDNYENTIYVTGENILGNIHII